MRINHALQSLINRSIARPNIGRCRFGRCAFFALTFFVMLFCAGCGDDSKPSDPVDPSEKYPGGETTNDLLLGSNAFTRDASNITNAHQLEFFAGNSFFNQPWVSAPASTANRDGLGPFFNARSCAACHFKDGRGRPPLEHDEPFVSMLIRLSVPGEDEHGGVLFDPNYGGQIQPFAIGEILPEATPRVTYQSVPGTYGDGTTYELLDPTYQFDNPNYGEFSPDLLFSARVAPQVIGLGLLESIPVSRLEELADPEDANGDGISGRINRVWNRIDEDITVGRFGWKAEEPSVRQQVAGAFLGDMGLTTPINPDNDCQEAQIDCIRAENGGEPEITPEIFEAIVTYSQLLAVPVRRNFDDPTVVRGRTVFRDLGCASCHTPDHTTGPNTKLPEVAGQRIWPYSDMLLHDMGEGLADGRPIFEASGSEWRTPPLWGLGLVEKVNQHDRLLHDGRARGFAEAILWHGGEAEPAKEAFRNADAQTREALIAFLHSL